MSTWQRLVVAGLVAVATALHAAGCGEGSSRPPADGPVITSLDPTHGPVGRAVTVQGSHFESDVRLNSVFFGGVQATARSSTSTEIVCEVPPGVSQGAQQVTVSTRAGTSAASSFTVDPPGAGAPSVTQLTPTSGSVGTRVIVRGSGFAPNPAGNEVLFNGRAATVHTASADRIETTVPAGATSGPLVVKTSAGPSNGVHFAVTSAQPGNQGSSGSMGRDYLTASPYTHLLVEVDYVDGNAPDASALDLLKTRLEERCNKPGGITIQVGDRIPDPGISTWRISDIRATESQWRNNYHASNTAVLYVLYVGGGYEGDSNGGRVLGVSYSGSSFCMFKDAMRGSVTVLVTGEVIERAVLVHEAGHNLGLVNNGTAMVHNHEDPSHRGHDHDQSCVMYWAVESSAISQLLGTIPTQFDAHCIEDLRAAGGR